MFLFVPFAKQSTLLVCQVILTVADVAT